MTTINKKVSLEELGLIVQGIDRYLPRAMQNVVRASVSAMIRDVAENRMSGQYLGIVTGTARRSVRGTGSVEGDQSKVTGAFGSPLGYVRAHEEGFHGPVQVRAHTRRLVKITTKRGKLSKAAQRRTKERLSRGGKLSAYVRAHTRIVNIRAKRFFRDTLLQEVGALPSLLAGPRQNLETRINTALRILAETGKPPKVSDLSR